MLGILEMLEVLGDFGDAGNVGVLEMPQHTHICQKEEPWGLN